MFQGLKKRPALDSGIPVNAFRIVAEPRLRAGIHSDPSFNRYFFGLLISKIPGEFLSGDTVDKVYVNVNNLTSTLFNVKIPCLEGRDH